jgi:hypothetical protein
MPVGVQSSGLVLGTLGAHKAWATLGLAVVLLEWLRRATPVEESHPREEA